MEKIDPVKNANYRIKKIVKTYQATPGLTNFTWVTKKDFRLEKRDLLLLIWMAAVMAGVYILPSEDGYLQEIFICASILFCGGITYLSIVNGLKMFKEKIWHDDYVSEEDLLYLGENDDLNACLLSQYTVPSTITYSGLEKNREIILSLIQGRILSNQVKQ